MTLFKFDLLLTEDIKLALSIVQEKYSKAFVAGGCLRDLAFNKPIKDIDIFIPSSTKEFDIDISSFSVQFQPQPTREKGSDDGENSFSIYYDCDEVELPINIIFIPENMTIESKLNSFDIDICEIAYDGKDVLVSNNFIKFYFSSNRKFKIKYLSSHSDRVIEKYSDYRYEVVEYNLNLGDNN